MGDDGGELALARDHGLEGGIIGPDLVAPVRGRCPLREEALGMDWNIAPVATKVMRVRASMMRGIETAFRTAHA